MMTCVVVPTRAKAKVLQTDKIELGPEQAMSCFWCAVPQFQTVKLTADLQHAALLRTVELDSHHGRLKGAPHAYGTPDGLEERGSDPQ